MPQVDLGTFYKANPSFVWGPALLTATIQAVTRLPKVAAFTAANGWATYGLQDAATYAIFAIILAYAAHGWFATHVSQPRQLQSYDKHLEPGEKNSAYVDRVPPSNEAVRTTAALLTSLIYAGVPFAPATTSWPVFIGWTFGLALYWDAHFFVVHRVCHLYPTLYKNVHKLHHSNKQPGPFTAYFVTYQSHVLTEQLVVLIAAAAGLPRDVFTWTLWWGTLGTYVEHCGHDVHDIKLSPLPITFGQLSTALSPWSLVLGGESAAHHDWHHEKFLTNYALSFTYLDRLFGSYHPGRVPGAFAGLDSASIAKAAKARDALPEIDETPAQATSPEKEYFTSEDGMPLTSEELAAMKQAEAKKAEANKVEEKAAPSAEESKKVPTAQYTELRLSTTDDWLVQGAAFDKYAEDGNIVRNVLELVEKMKVRARAPEPAHVPPPADSDAAVAAAHAPPRLFAPPPLAHPHPNAFRRPFWPPADAPRPSRIPPLAGRARRDRRDGRHVRALAADGHARAPLRRRYRDGRLRAAARHWRGPFGYQPRRD